jgi:ABC-type dipeptide/oligopeptide/nickel transport system permease component
VKRWWLRPAVRLAAAALLPVLVPAVITALIWLLPGDPASIICPPEFCGASSASLAERWNLDGGPGEFFWAWATAALQGNFGNSWRLMQGVGIGSLLAESIPNTLLLISLALIPVSLGVVAAASEALPAKFDGVLYLIGLTPALLLAIMAAAIIELSMGSGSLIGSGQWVRLLLGAAVLGAADGAFSGAVTGTRSVFTRENRQRYVGISVLRGESRLSNTLPNVAPALAGQLRARTVQLLSGTVIVEVILRINGLGDLLWGGTLLQDFGVVLACATCFAVICSALLTAQALVEISAAIWIRRAPAMPAVAR